MQVEAVVEALVTGLRAYGVTATADVRSTGAGLWFVALDAEPDGIDVEVAEHHDRVRVLWSGAHGGRRQPWRRPQLRRSRRRSPHPAVGAASVHA